MHICGNIHGFIWESMTRNNCNTYLVDGPARILIDPGHLDLFDHVNRGLGELGIQIKDLDLVVCTHAHPDHLESVQLFKEAGIKVTYHRQDWELVKAMEEHVGAAFQAGIEAITPDFFLGEGEINVKETHFRIYHTPGHSPGSICLYEPGERVLITGDVVFKEGVGRTDLPAGNGTQLKESIRRLSDLDVEYVLPGHGGIVSGTREVKMTFEQIVNFWFAHI